MSTRCTIKFTEGRTVFAEVYRHSDGYPDGEHGVPADLTRFFDDVENQTTDTRFEDASYLAAKFVVWQAAQNAESPARPLAFRSIGIVRRSPADIEYRYTVDCRPGGGRPVVRWKHA